MTDYKFTAYVCATCGYTQDFEGANCPNDGDNLNAKTGEDSPVTIVIADTEDIVNSTITEVDGHDEQLDRPIYVERPPTEDEIAERDALRQASLDAVMAAETKATTEVTLS